MQSYQQFDSVPPKTAGYAGDVNEAERQTPYDETSRVSKYETALPIRIDVAAALTYLVGAFTGILFLVLETKNDYVRFNAWQSIILFLPLTVSSRLRLYCEK